MDRWVAETEILLRADGRAGDAVTVRLGGRRRLVLRLGAERNTSGPPKLTITAVPAKTCVSSWPVLPDAATWLLPDLELLNAGLIGADQLHPLVAQALVPERSPTVAPRTSDNAGSPRYVECRGARHRIGLVNGVLAPLDHSAAEVRREELLTVLGGAPLPCLQAIDDAHRRPECLTDVRARLDHGDTAGALATVEGLLGSDALLRDGALREELETAALRRNTHGLFRAGLAGMGPKKHDLDRRCRGRGSRAQRRHAASR